MIKIDKTAPDFNLQDQDGVSRKLIDFEGKWLILFFYPMDDTPGWTVEARAFGESLIQYNELDAVVYGVSPDSVESHKKFRDKYGFAVNLLADPTSEMSEQFGSVGKRRSFLIDGEGVLRKVYDKVKVSDHAVEVLKDLGVMIKDWTQCRIIYLFRKDLKHTCRMEEQTDINLKTRRI